MSIEAMQKTFDFLHDLWELKQTVRSDRHKKVMWELDRAIGKLEKQTPVAYLSASGIRFDGDIEPRDGSVVKLYTTPPEREWVGLTDKEITDLWTSISDEPDKMKIWCIGYAIEAKLREKNAYGWHLVGNRTQYLDELRGGVEENP